MSEQNNPNEVVLRKPVKELYENIFRSYTIFVKPEDMSDYQEEILFPEINEKLKKNKQDITYRDSYKAQGLYEGGYHPVNIVQSEIEDIFAQ